MKQALLLAAADPSLGGVLILGEKGTAKSTAARALAGLWPGQGRLVTLPLGATEDRVVGALDLEAALSTGRLKAEPGLLARADRGVLYIDEVNLLDEHLSALILDAAASGLVRLEREGVCLTYPARFVLVGTMNPEEGQAPPQLLDRFGLAVAVRGETDPEARRELIRRRLAFEADPAGFTSLWQSREAALAQRLAAARRLLPQISVPPSLFDQAGRLAQAARVSGQRAEICLVKAARAQAALAGRRQVHPDDLEEVADLALLHRRRALAGPSRPVQARRLPVPELPDIQDVPRCSPEPAQAGRPASGDLAGDLLGGERVFEAESTFALATWENRRQGGFLERSGRRFRRETGDGSGRYVRASLERLGREVALDATLRAAAPHQLHRPPNGLAIRLAAPDIREKVKVKTFGRLVVFAVDGSGSMGSLSRMREAKAAALSLLAEAYQKRDRVGLISFRGLGAQVLLSPTNSVELAGQALAGLPIGGKTPLAHGLVAALGLVDRELRRDGRLNPLIVVLTDGKPNIPLAEEADAWDEVLDLAPSLRRPGLTYLVVDTDPSNYLSCGLCRELAEALGGRQVKLDRLRAEGLVRLVRETAAQRH